MVAPISPHSSQEDLAILPSQCSDSASQKTRTRIVIMGAAGRDFHNFNQVYRDDPTVEVVAFTAAQISGISDRTQVRCSPAPHRCRCGLYRLDASDCKTTARNHSPTAT